MFFDAHTNSWAVIRHADCLAVADDADTFCAYEAADGGDELRNHEVRQLLGPGLSPSAMRGLENELHWHARAIVVAAVERRRCDFGAEVATAMTLKSAARILGVPEPDREKWFGWHHAQSSAAGELDAYAVRLVEAKRRHREADLLSRLVGRLPADDVLAFYRLFHRSVVVMTRDAIVLGMVALVEHPDQWALLRQDRTLMRRGIEELLRWTSPTPFDHRIARRDVSVGDVEVAAGQTLTLWWASANRDEAVFRDPLRLDVQRDPNPHLAFGHGTRGCIGGTLARMVMRLVFDELVERCERVELGRRSAAPFPHLPVVLHPAGS